MSGAFSRAIKEANFSVRVNTDGERSFGGNANINRDRNSGNSSNRGDNGGRWQRGGYNRGGSSFRGRGRGNRGQGRGRGRGRGHGSYHPRSRFDEDDEGDSMMDSERQGGSNRYNPYGRGSANSRRRDRSPENRVDDVDGDSGWWKIVIPEGKKHSRDWLLARLKSICTEPFSPVNFHIFQDNAVFFVNEKSAADGLKAASNKITTKDGSKLFLSVRPSRPPRNQGGSTGNNNSGAPINTEVETSPEKLEVYKDCLAKRFDPEAVKLDLSNLFFDKVLRAGEVETKIWKPVVINTILEIIHQLCSTLKILDLSNNQIQRLSILENLSEKCPALEEINLSKNAIRFTGELAKLKSHKNIIKLWFSENPASEQYKNDVGEYQEEVRNHLPNLKELDGTVLPPSLKLAFDLDETAASLPKSLGNYPPNSEASSLVVVFLKNFFQIYDAADVNDRQQLLPAYHNDAVFSLCCNTGVPTSENNANSLKDYLKHNHDIENMNDRTNREQLVKHKKLTVVALLTELPQTKHNFNSFTLDIPFVTAECLMFVVKGTFLDGNGQVLRGFTRTFVAVPEKNSQLLLINDQLHVRAATEKQMKVQSVGNVPVVAQTTSTVQNSSYTTEQEELVKKFSMESKMNLKWSLDALISNGWDFKQAAVKFGELKSQGKIPPEAFQ
ncbi:nuclear RNA export factor 1-like [Hydractinia symbiolongicarpus]|uniref:nuclear RNA export factor 1-like n=1 Tax=Hydractinia symbiolongicarpus TaxID=13093 RepID=UPI0025507395|nr:nuclear RNA export factor 1-like [Hydractinia symbiolongicarpus]